jgi:cytosine/adenosine deaminase-related metal-dependent hydrolase
MKRLLRNALVDTGGGVFAARDISIRDGRIEAVSASLQTSDYDEVLDLSGHAAIPGLLNCHTHSNENWFRGRFDNLPLEPWMLFSYPVLYGPAPTARDVYLRTLIGAMEMIRTGTTYVVDFIYEFAGLTEERLQAMVDAYRHAGMRALICLAVADRSYHETVVLAEDLLPDDVAKTLKDNPPPTAGEWLSLARDMVRRFHRPDSGIAIGIGPSGPQRCSDELLLGARALADELDLQVHTHVLETKMQASSGRLLYGTTIVAHLERIGFLSPRTHLVHGVWLTDGDIASLARTGATVVHNPISNLKLGSGISSIGKLLRRGVTVSLGTDGMCAGDGQNMFEALKLASILHKVDGSSYENWVGAREAWRIACDGGAAAVGSRGWVGRLAPGHAADIVCLDLSDPAFIPLNDPLLHLSLQIPTQALRHVMVAGDWAMRDRALARLDERAILTEVADRAPTVLQHHGDAFAFGDALLPSLREGWERTLAADLGVNAYSKCSCGQGQTPPRSTDGHQTTNPATVYGNG